jgi:catechol 2,3-dioxygenase-like lactoylglutathione lyase family enzyme
MATAYLEHVNITVSDPDRTATMLTELFGWRERWRGAAKDDGLSIHIGGDDFYLVVYAKAGVGEGPADTGAFKGGLNHVGVVVEDIDAVEAKVVAGGFKPRNHADYEPGRRFYFDDADGIEFEVVAYP